jgi:hypothetical protein
MIAVFRPLSGWVFAAGPFRSVDRRSPAKCAALGLMIAVFRPIVQESHAFCRRNAISCACAKQIGPAALTNRAIQLHFVPAGSGCAARSCAPRCIGPHSWHGVSTYGLVIAVFRPIVQETYALCRRKVISRACATRRPGARAEGVGAAGSGAEVRVAGGPGGGGPGGGGPGGGRSGWRRSARLGRGQRSASRGLRMEGGSGLAGGASSGGRRGGGPRAGGRFRWRGLLRAAGGERQAWVERTLESNV